MTSTARLNHSWPIIKTPKHVPGRVRRRASTFGAVTVFLVPLVFTLIVAALAAILSYFDVEAAEFGFGGLTFLSTFVTIFALCACIFAIPAMEIAIKFGKAGWLVAIGTSAVLSLSIYVWLFEHDVNLVGSLIFTGLGVLFGALFWLAARLSTPMAFVSYGSGKQT